MKHKICKTLKEHTGSQAIMGGFVAVGLCIVTLVVIEYAHLNDVSKAVRDAVQDAVTTSCTENYAQVYNGVREGYSGGYTLSHGNWSETINSGDAYSKIDNVLGTRKEGDADVKYVDGKKEFWLSGLDVQMTNAPFAPDSADNAGKLTGIASVDVSVPMGFNWGVPPMQLHLKVIAGYTPKF